MFNSYKSQLNDIQLLQIFGTNNGTFEPHNEVDLIFFRTYFELIFSHVNKARFIDVDFNIKIFKSRIYYLKNVLSKFLI